jgi:transcriptional regulator with XRE-family HTH domain
MEGTVMANIDYKLIGRRIRERRLLANYSQEQLAWEAELSATYISYIENGSKKPSLESLVSICNVLGITLDSLLSGNQVHSNYDYQTDIAMIMKGTSSPEKRLIYELIYALLGIFRKNEWELITLDEIDHYRKKY